MERSREEIDEQRNRAANIGDRTGTLYSGMTYEQGVSDALSWAVGDSEDKPLNDEDAGEFDE